MEFRNSINEDLLYRKLNGKKLSVGNEYENFVEWQTNNSLLHVHVIVALICLVFLLLLS